MTVGYGHRNYKPHGLTPYGRYQKKKDKKQRILDKIERLLQRDNRK